MRHRWVAGLVSIGAILIGSFVATLLVAKPAQSADPPLVSVYPTPGTHYASPRTQLSIRGVTPSTLGAVVMTGSRTGAHAFTVRAHPDGKGVSLGPTVPFKRKETISVETTLNVRNARDGDFPITTAATGNSVKPPKSEEAADRRSQIQVIHSRPDLRPTRVGVDRAARGRAPGWLFSAPKLGPGQNGPMILDDRGQMSWFRGVPKGLEADDFRTQRLNGKPVLTWWQGFVNYGTGTGTGQVYDQRYKKIAEVRAGNGYDGLDPHEFRLTDHGTAIVSVQDLVYRDLSSIGGAKTAQVFDAIVQEIDVATGLVLFEWHSLDHVGLRESHIPPPKGKGHLFDYFHVNSVDPYEPGKLLVSGRNTWGLYKIDTNTGHVDWRLGGKKSSFRMGRNSGFAFQHDARVQKSGIITLFDNGAAPPVHSVSRGIGIRVRGKNARLVKDYRHSTKLLSGSQGNNQRLPNGNAFIGWGANPYLSEYSPHGRELFSANFTKGTMTYRSYRLAWSGRPDTRPAVAASTNGKTTTVYASWNGATDVSRWEILAGRSPAALKAVATVARRSFESVKSIRGAEPSVAVQAKDATGRVLAVSSVIKPRRLKR